MNKRPFSLKVFYSKFAFIFLNSNYPCLLSAYIFTCDLSGGRYDMERGE